MEVRGDEPPRDALDGDAEVGGAGGGGEGGLLWVEVGLVNVRGCFSFFYDAPRIRRGQPPTTTKTDLIVVLLLFLLPVRPGRLFLSLQPPFGRGGLSGGGGIALML